MTAPKSKTILVTGDLVWDTHVARLPVTGHGYYDPHGQTQLTNRYGGAWYLAEVISAAVAAHNAACLKNDDAGKSADKKRQLAATVNAPVKAKHEKIEGKKCPSGIAKGFSVWEWHEGDKKSAEMKLAKSAKPSNEPALEIKWVKDAAEPGAWRIAEFLGCREAVWDSSRPGPKFESEPKQADVLVIDDLGLGFARSETAWPDCLRAAAPPAAIVVKATPPFDSALWKKLLQPEWAARLTVVISAATLRNVGADIARGLSWDRAIEDLQREFSSGGTGWVFRECQRVVVICGRSGAAVFSRSARSPEEATTLPAQLQFERFVFDPNHLEETWSGQYAGYSFGTASVMAAALVCHGLEEIQPSTHLSVGRGLAAAREIHRHGAGHDPKHFNLQAADGLIFTGDAKARPWEEFQSAFSRALLDGPVLFNETPPPPSLLTDVTGTGLPFLTVTAEDIVRRGFKQPLRGVPRLQCGDYFTVDREEIENLNTVRSMIEDYRASKDKRPLSLAVFGAPGSGKSFAIKQLADSIFGSQRAVVECNLSQLRDLDDLHEAFHEVRDKSVQGQMPLVFWDEFDSQRDGEDLGWLKEFLSPMQDSEFVSHGKKHPFARCIFVFAGGTSATFQKFDRSETETDTGFKSAKGPDFVSRLRGYVNIKGPNPSDEGTDDVHVIRRGILLRSLLERHHPKVFHPQTKELNIHARVLAAFLNTDTYRHGSRSIEQIVSLSHLHGKQHFGPSELPPKEVIKLHATEDFSKIANDNSHYQITPADVERLAEIKHTNWYNSKKASGYVWGGQRDDKATPPTHPLCKPYAELKDSDKDGNRLPARLSILRLESCGFQVVTKDQAVGKAVTAVDEETLNKLARSEHRRWMREKLIRGVSYAGDSSDASLLHKDICKFGSLGNPESKLDHEIIAAVFAFLEQKGLVLVRKMETTQPAK